MVRRGDTLYGIAQRLGTDVQTLAQNNGLRPGDRLHAGFLRSVLGMLLQFLRFVGFHGVQLPL